MLESRDFHKIATGGLGNIRSRVAHSCLMYHGYLYLGATHPNAEGEQDRARIMRYSFETREWEQVHISPMVEADERHRAQDVLRPGSVRLQSLQGLVPRERGFRGMTSFKGRSDATEVLYVSTISNQGSLLLRSENGENFQVVSEPGLIDPSFLSFRSLTPFQGKLFTTPIGSIKDGVLDRNGTSRAVVLVSEDPAKGIWHEASLPGFGNEDNRVVFQMAVLGDYLYAGTGNPMLGFELWKTRAEGAPPYQWEKVIDKGAYRYNLNEGAVSMVPFNGALYIGTGLPGLGYDKAYDVGPAASELIRVFPDDSWELVVGTPRFSPHGLQIPLSEMGPGFDDSFNSVFWRMGVHDNRLFVGTHHWGIYQTAFLGNGQPQGGFHLWSSEDGEQWDAVTLDGFGNPFAVGVRTLVSTPHGLLIGTDDHSVIKQRAERMSGRKGLFNLEEGGFELWLGDDHQGRGDHVVGPFG